MKIIDIVNDFNQIKIAQIRHIKELIGKIEKSGVLLNETEIELNIEGCIFDYPATPRFIDYFLDFLSHQQGDKKLHIRLDGLLNREVYILYILVLEGEFFGISDKIDSDEDVGQWRNLINEKLKEKNIILTVLFVPDNKEYSYGN